MTEIHPRGTPPKTIICSRVVLRKGLGPDGFWKIKINKGFSCKIRPQRTFPLSSRKEGGSMQLAETTEDSDVSIGQIEVDT